jgi:transposase-like protein
MQNNKNIPSYEEYVEAVKDSKNADEVLNNLKKLFAPTLETMLEAEMNNHLGYEKHSQSGNNSGNSRNGYSAKTMKTSMGQTEINIPRDRNSEFEPQIVKKYETASNEVEEKIIGLYGLGNTVRDIKSFISELYHIDISSSTVSQVTDKVLPLVEQWQNRPLEKMYPFVFLDGIHFKMRKDQRIITVCAYIVIGINTDGYKDVLGIWIAKEESASFWMNVLTDLRNRGVEDILFLSADGLSGLPKTVESIFPNTIFQHCIVHQIRNTLKYISSKDMKVFAKDLRGVYKATNEKSAKRHLEKMITSWPQYKGALELWKKNWSTLSPFFDYSPEIRKILYTTNMIESVNRQYRKITKTTSIFPSEKSILKLLYLGTMNMQKNWCKSIPHWGKIILQLAILFPERVKL